MNKQRIYVDTSVIGGCFDNEFSIWSNSLINDFKNSIFIPVLSEVTSAEILDAPDEVKEKYYELIAYNSEIIEITKESINLAELYQNKKILTSNYFDIALATISKVDILVSWNFKHIVHFDKIRLFNSVNIEMGYKPIEIYSPREVTYHED